MTKETLAQHLETIGDNSIDCISNQELAQKVTLSLNNKKPLRVKVGFDPTARDIHLGHTVLLRKLRKIQDLGHIVYLIIGDFTAQIGDPSGKSELRPLLTGKEIKDNARTYTNQAFKILDKKKTKIIYNSRWYRSMPIAKLISLLSRYTVAQLAQRDDFSKRLEQNKPLTLQEFIYPIIQGYDSVMIKADIEFGGTDQKFNLIVGRHLQESFKQSPQIVITLPLLVGLDGRNKMSKSLGNYIGITDDPKSMFGKLMSISDDMMWEYARFLTDLDCVVLKRMHPKEAKLLLAQTIVAFYHAPSVAKLEREEFERVFSQKEIPSDIPRYATSKETIDIIDVLYESGCVSSKREARRLFEQKSISCKDQPLVSPRVTIPSEGIILRIGKRKFLNIICRKE